MNVVTFSQHYVIVFNGCVRIFVLVKRHHIIWKFSTIFFVVLFDLGIYAENNQLNAQTHVGRSSATIDDTTKKVQSLDTVRFDMYGNLRVDDPLYNKRDHWYVPAFNIVGQEVLLNLADQYLLNFDWARVGLKSWGSNLTAGAPWGNGWIWDNTRFANDMFLHPYTGANYFDAARASGYSFWESIYLYLWRELFMENIRRERSAGTK